MADLRKDFSWRIAFTQFYLSFFMFIWVACFIVGCSLTVTSHADIMYCSSGVYIFVFTMLTCNTVHRLEILGYIIYFIGVCFMFSDPHASKIGMEGQSYLGDLIAFLGAGGCAMYVYLAKRNELGLHPYVTCTYMFVFLCIHQFMIFPFFSDSQNFFSFDIEYGAFGWLADSYSMSLVQYSWLRYDYRDSLKTAELFIYLIINNILFYIGINAPITGTNKLSIIIFCILDVFLETLDFILPFLYFPIQIVAGAMLLEPFFAQLAGILLGQDKMPGINTLFGLILMSIGFIIAGFGAKCKEDKVKIRNLKIKENSHLHNCSDKDNL